MENRIYLVMVGLFSRYSSSSSNIDIFLIEKYVTGASFQRNQ